MGGGYVGLYAALGLQRRLRPDEATITLVNPESFALYQPFLPEAASGSIEPRHVVVPLRPLLRRRSRLITGTVESLDHERRTAAIVPAGGEPFELPYDVVVLAPGSVSRVLPIPGLAEQGIGFTSLAEAIYLRNRVLSRMDAAESTEDEAVRRRLLTFVFVGGGYAGIEAIAELEDMARFACRSYQRVRPHDLRWVIVEAADRILPELTLPLGAYALSQLEARGFQIHLGTRLRSAVGGHLELSNGRTYDADTLVWTAGVRPNPMLQRTGLPLDEKGRLVADECLRVRGVEGAWTAGDGAAVPDVIAGGICPPTAQHALRQAKRLAENLVASLHGQPLRPFRYRNLGGLATLGLYKGVALVVGVPIKGFPAWALHRSYHVLRVPTLNRKARVIADWTLALCFRRDVAQLGSLQRPRDRFAQAMEVSPSPGGPEPSAQTWSADQIKPA